MKNIKNKDKFEKAGKNQEKQGITGENKGKCRKTRKPSKTNKGEEKRRKARKTSKMRKSEEISQN